MTTVYDIARQAGLSTATVSRVLHGSSLFRPETRQRVVDVIERLGFVPNGSAQGLSMRRKDIIGLVALERGADEIDIERSSQLYVDEIVHAAGGAGAAFPPLPGVQDSRRVCFAGGPPDSPDAKQRLAAFGEAVRAADGCS